MSDADGHTAYIRVCVLLPEHAVISIIVRVAVAIFDCHDNVSQ